MMGENREQRRRRGRDRRLTTRQARAILQNAQSSQCPGLLGRWCATVGNLRNQRGRQVTFPSFIMAAALALAIVIIPQASEDFDALQPQAQVIKAVPGAISQIAPLSDARRAKICEQTSGGPSFTNLTIHTSHPGSTVFGFDDSCKARFTNVEVVGPGQAISGRNSIGMRIDNFGIRQNEQVSLSGEVQADVPIERRPLPDCDHISTTEYSKPIVAAAIDLDDSCDASLSNSHLAIRRNGLSARGAFGLSITNNWVSFVDGSFRH